MSTLPLPVTNTKPVYNDLSHIHSRPSEYGLDIADLHGLTIMKTTPDGGFDYKSTAQYAPDSDTQSAKVFLRYFNNELLYVGQFKEWRLWDGRVYAKVSEDSAARAIISYAEALEREAMALSEWIYESAKQVDPNPGSDEFKKEKDRLTAPLAGFFSYAKALQGNAGQEKLVKTLQRRAAANADAFDADLSVFVVNNGVIDIEQTQQARQVVLHPHDSGRLVTQYAPVDYVPGATSEHFDKYLITSLPDAEVRRYLQKWSGAAMRGKPVDKGFLNLKGPKDSGKSLFENITRRIMGSYAIVMEPRVFIKSKADSTFDAHEIKGRRFVLTSEPPEGEYLDDNVLKSFTGGDVKRTRTLYGKFTEWRPQCTIFIASNHVLKYNAVDEAMGQRAKIINFPNKFYRSYVPGKLQADLDLEDKIMAESSGVLNWFLDGLLAYFSEGLGEEPESVYEQRLEAEEEMDSRADWLSWAIENEVILEIPEVHQEEVPASATLKASDAYDNYKVWCERGGNRPYNMRNFGSYMKNKTSTGKSAGTRYLDFQKGPKFSNVAPMKEDVHNI